MTCPSCGQELPGAFPFCPFCGSPLAEHAPAPGRAERKVVTVLFADLVGFTAIAERLDPEDVAALLTPYHASLRREIERFGGTVEKFIGDAVMALFGAPVAHEDDPERAVRAALAIRDWAAEREAPHVRIAVNTGEALVSLDARAREGEGMAAGDVVNTAARLQAGAPLNSVLVGELTHRATVDVFDYRSVEAVIGKGKSEPVPAWEALRARARFGVDVTRSVTTPLVGRAREVDLLGSTLARVRADRSPQLVTLVGVPGIGKSRMVHELLDSFEQDADLVTWRQGRSLPYGEGVTFWALTEIVKAEAGILEGDGADASAAKLGHAIGRVARDEAEAHWLERHLGALVGLAEDGPSQLDERFAAWRTYFEAIADQRPLVLVFEDLHWADDALLDFVDELVTRTADVPLYVLGTARPELLARRPGWGGGKPNAMAISLSPLSNEETASLVRSLHDESLLDPALRDALVERAGGNPLYAEQFVRALGESRGLQELPETVQGVIAARLDALPSDEKSLLQDAAVVGQVFWSGALGIARQGADEILHALERKEFVRRARGSSVAGESEWTISHILIRDVAYGQIPRAERSAKHRRVASWIESLGRPEEQAELLAHHYLSALQLAEAAGLGGDSNLAGRVRQALVSAGERALALPAFSAAEEFFRTALDLSSDGDPDRARLLLLLARARFATANQGLDTAVQASELFSEADDPEGVAEARTLAAQIAWRAGDRGGSDSHIAAALEAVADRPMSPAKANALARLSGFHMLAGEFDDSIRVGAEAFAAFDRLGLEGPGARLHITVGCARCCLGDPGGFDEIEAGIALARQVGDVDALWIGYGNLGSELFFFGRIADARRAWNEELDLCKRYGLARVQHDSQVGLACVAFLDGRWDEARALADAFLPEGKEEHEYAEPVVRSLRATIRLARGDVAGASADSSAATQLARTSDAQAQASAYCVRAVFALETGFLDEAHALATDLAAIGTVLLPALCAGYPTMADVAWVFRDLGRSTELGAILDATPIDSPWIEIARAIGDGDFVRAADVSDEIGHAAGAANARRRAAKQLAEEGRSDEADTQLEHALAFYRAARATRLVGECEALLAGIAS